VGSAGLEEAGVASSYASSSRPPKKPPTGAAFYIIGAFGNLLDLRFLELDVLARDGIVLLERQLIGFRPGVLFGDVEEASVSGRQELDFDGCGLGHNDLLGAFGTCRKSTM
jgi:hypothetical protein